MKNQKGITLVALVVTIVVLLILAGITIAYVMQGDSIFGKAKEAKSATNIDSVKTTVSMAILELQANYYDPKTQNDAIFTDGDTITTALNGYMHSTMTLSDIAFTGLTSTPKTFYFTKAKLTVAGTNAEYTVAYTSAGGLVVTEGYTAGA